MPTSPTYEKSVFINCPYDDAYLPIFRAIVFTLQYLEFTPQTAMTSELGGTRFSKIVKLIKECRLGIHDISRIELDHDSNLPRFNMPFELGMDIGCREMCEENSPHKSKHHLILSKDAYVFAKYLSDIAGYDGKAHNDDPLEAIIAVRNWLRGVTAHMQGGEAIQAAYNLFNDQFDAICGKLKLKPSEITMVDFTYIVGYWLEEQRATASS